MKNDMKRVEQNKSPREKNRPDKRNLTSKLNHYHAGGKCSELNVNYIFYI